MFSSGCKTNTRRNTENPQGEDELLQTWSFCFKMMKLWPTGREDRCRGSQSGWWRSRQRGASELVLVLYRFFTEQQERDSQASKVDLESLITILFQQLKFFLSIHTFDFMLQFRVCVGMCVLIRVHDLDRLADHVHRQGGHSFGEDSCGSGFVSVLTPGTNTKRREALSNNKTSLGHWSGVVFRCWIRICFQRIYLPSSGTGVGS